MNVVFLDIDGVVNTYIVDTKPFPIKNGGKTKGDDFYFLLCDEYDEYVSNRQALMCLNLLCYETNAKIVITSSWRKNKDGLEITKRALYNSGLLSNIEIIGATPILNDFRGEEIKFYLDEHPEIKNYVILDDDSDVLNEQLDHFVKTDNYVGFTYRDYLKAKEILKSKSEIKIEDKAKKLK